MICVAVTEYDDENVVEDCEAGWKRFCADTLAKTYFYLSNLGSRRVQFPPRNRKKMEVLRRHVAAFLWVTQGTGGAFTFDACCRDCGLCPHLVRCRMLAVCRPSADINLVVEWVGRQKEQLYGNGRRKDRRSGRVGTRIVAVVGHIRRKNQQRQGGRSHQATHVRSAKDKDAC